MFHNKMINHPSPYFDDYTAASNIRASVRSAGAVKSGSSGDSRDDVQNSEENTVGHADSAKIPQSIFVHHRIKCTSIKTLEIRRWSSLKSLRTLPNQ